MKPLMSLDPAAMTAFVLNVLLLLTVVCLIALIAARWVLRHQPSLRYTVCLTGLVCLLFSPLVVCLQNRVGGSLLILSLPHTLSDSPSPKPSDAPMLRMSPGADVPVHEVSIPQKSISWVLWGMFAAWVTGVVWGFVRFALGLRAALHLANRIRPWSAAAHDAMLPQVERALGCSLPPVFTSQHVESPVSVGLFRPLVILPEGLPEVLSPTQLRHVLLHECAHIAFRHTFGGLVERSVRLLFWPHPLVSALCRELALAREEVCDNVASQEDGAACYARTLLAIAQGVLPAPNIPSSLALLGQETSLEERITGLLHPRRNRMVRVKRGKLWAVTGVVVCAAVATMTVRIVAAEGKPKHVADTAEYAPVRQAGRDGAAIKRNAQTVPLAVTTSVAMQPAGHRLATHDRAASHSLARAARRKAQDSYNRNGNGNNTFGRGDQNGGGNDSGSGDNTFRTFRRGNHNGNGNNNFGGQYQNDRNGNPTVGSSAAPSGSVMLTHQNDGNGNSSVGRGNHNGANDQTLGRGNHNGGGNNIGDGNTTSEKGTQPGNGNNNFGGGN